MSERFYTWSINTMGGPWGSGIPSVDVAIALAMDLERYRYNDDDVLERVEVIIEDGREDPDEPQWFEVRGGDSRGVGVCPERRCVSCGQTDAGGR